LERKRRTLTTKNVTDVWVKDLRKEKIKGQ